MSSVHEMNNNGINRITYYYNKEYENKEDKRRITRIDISIVNKIIESGHY